MTRRAGAFYRLPKWLQRWLTAHCPGWRICVPTRAYVPEVEILGMVLVEVETTGCTHWGACVRVARRTQLHPRTVARIVSRRALGPPRMDPEFGGR